MIEIREYDGKYVVMNLSSNQTMFGNVLMPKGLERGETPTHFTLSEAQAVNNAYFEYFSKEYISDKRKIASGKRSVLDLKDYDIAVEHVVAIRDLTEDFAKAGVNINLGKEALKSGGDGGIHG